MNKLHCLAAAALTAASAGAIGQAATASVGPALDRTAVVTRDAEKAVLLGAARAGTRVVAVGERGLILFSDNDGASWRQATVPVSVTLTAVRFADKDNGFAVGHGGIVLSTSDAGKSWTRRLDGLQIAKMELAAAQVANEPAALKRAERFGTDGPDKPMLDLWVWDAQRLLVVGAYGIALESLDGGKSWATWRPRLDNPKELHLYAVRSQGTRMVVAGEQGLLLLSVDGGRSFKRVEVPYKGSFFTVEIPDDRAIVVAGLRGNAFRSADGGTTWSPLASPVPVSITGSALLFDGQMLLANQAGMLMRVTADKLVPLKAEPLPPLNFILPLAEKRLLALSVQGAQRLDVPSVP